MYKLLLFLLFSVFFMTLYALQTDEEMAVRALFIGKRGLNAAVHAAAQQADQDKLAKGVRSIDPLLAKETADLYLQGNLRLDSANQPLPGTFFQSKPEVLLFQIINENHVFPYTYSNAAFGYTVTMKHPGVIMFISLAYPRTYGVLGPISWVVKSSAEMTF